MCEAWLEGRQEAGRKLLQIPGEMVRPEDLGAGAPKEEDKREQRQE